VPAESASILETGVFGNGRPYACGYASSQSPVRDAGDPVRINLWRYCFGNINRAPSSLLRERASEDSIANCLDLAVIGP
jgi:hypothetical protein